MLYPYQWITLGDIEALKRKTKEILVKRAMNTLKVPASQLVIREIMYGDGSTDASVGNGWVDLSSETQQTDNMVAWAQDAGDFTTANDYDYVSATTGDYRKVQMGNFLGFFGWGDLSQQGGVLTGPQTGGFPSLGNILGVKFTTGGRTKDVWSTERLYGQGLDVSGFSFDTDQNGNLEPRPVVFKQNEDVRIMMVSSEVTLDKFSCLRGYCVEEWEQHVSPSRWTKLGNGPYGSNDLSTDPGAEVTHHQKKALINYVTKTCYDLAAQTHKGRDLVISRDFIIADESHATERSHVDIDNKTAATAGLESYGQDATDLTALVLSSVVATGQKINDGMFSGIYGFTDRTPNPDLHYMAHLYGTGNRVSVPHVEHCYLYHENSPSGFYRTPIIYPENTPLDWQIACRLSTADKFITLNGPTVELKGEVIS